MFICMLTLVLASCGDDDGDDIHSNTDSSAVKKADYTITFKDEHHKETSKTVSDGYRLTEEDLQNSYKDYEFLGWYDGDKKVAVGDIVNRNLTLTAKWKVVVDEEHQAAFDISYSTEYGKNPRTISVDMGHKLTKDDLPKLTASGFTFVGWFNDDEEVKVGYKVVSNMDLIAKWKDESFHITYHSDYGDAPDIKTIEAGHKLSSEDLPQLSDKLHSFLGWSDGKRDFHVGDEVSSDLNLTAQWCYIYEDISENDLPDLSKYLGKHYRLKYSDSFTHEEYLKCKYDTSRISGVAKKTVNVEYIDIHVSGGTMPMSITLLDADFNVVNDVKRIEKINDYTYSLVFNEHFYCHGSCGFQPYFMDACGGPITGTSSAWFHYPYNVITSIEITLFEYNNLLYIGFDPDIIYMEPMSGILPNPEEILNDPNYVPSAEIMPWPPAGQKVDYNQYVNNHGLIFDNNGQLQFVQAEYYTYSVFLLPEVD